MHSSSRLSSLAVVVPFYNERASVEALYDRLLATLEPLGISLRFVFVDDGSTDRTLAILNEVASEDARVSVLSLARNFGHQIALTAGLDVAQADAVVTMDSDLQHPPETILEMVREFEAGSDVVYAVRRDDSGRGPLKQLAARAFYVVLGRLVEIDVFGGATDFRLMSREVVETLRQMREMHRYLRGMVPWIGFPYAIVYYDQQERYAGESKYTWKQLGRLARHGLFSFSTVPLDLITWLGFLLTILAGAYLVIVLYFAFFSDMRVVLPGWTSVIAVLLVVSGAQLISVGILAQYVGMIFEQVKERPLYVLKQGRMQNTERESQLSPSGSTESGTSVLEK